MTTWPSTWVPCWVSQVAPKNPPSWQKLPLFLLSLEGDLLDPMVNARRAWAGRDVGYAGRITGSISLRLKHGDKALHKTHGALHRALGITGEPANKGNGAALYLWRWHELDAGRFAEYLLSLAMDRRYAPSRGAEWVMLQASASWADAYLASRILLGGLPSTAQHRKGRFV